jgi:ferrous iron transport protein A
MSIQKLEELIPCFLELIKINGVNEIPLQRIADDLGVPISDIERVIDIAQSNDLIIKDQGVLKITEKGNEALRIHRAKYVHDRFIHPKRGLHRFLAKHKGNNSIDWHRHGLNNSNVSNFYQDLEGIQGRIEEVIPLTKLHVGEKGIVQFMFGGKGKVQRLADMGLTPGAEIILNKKALLQGPVEVCIRNTCLAIGYGIAKRIFVKPIQS